MSEPLQPTSVFSTGERVAFSWALMRAARSEGSQEEAINRMATQYEVLHRIAHSKDGQLLRARDEIRRLTHENEFMLRLVNERNNVGNAQATTRRRTYHYCAMTQIAPGSYSFTDGSIEVRGGAAPRISEIRAEVRPNKDLPPERMTILSLTLIHEERTE